MTLARAIFPDGKPFDIEGPPPYRSALLAPLVGVDFELPCDDPWVRAERTQAHAYLDGASDGWRAFPDWMDYLAPDSPGHALKRLERDLYLHAWRDWLSARRVLDVGCGIGRLAMGFLDRGADVYGVDGDLDSLRRCAWHAAGRPGRLDLYWSSVHRLPDVRVDVAVAAEVLCYVPDVDAALDGIVDRLEPGGALLGSVEARWGWAAAPDAPADAVDAALDGATLALPDEPRWVKTYDRDELRDLLDRHGLHVRSLEATHYFTDGPLERVLPDGISVDRLLVLEERCRTHPVWAPLNRAWTWVATRR